MVDFDIIYNKVSREYSECSSTQISSLMISIVIGMVVVFLSLIGIIQNNVNIPINDILNLWNFTFWLFIVIVIIFGGLEIFQIHNNRSRKRSVLDTEKLLDSYKNKIIRFPQESLAKIDDELIQQLKNFWISKFDIQKIKEIIENEIEQKLENKSTPI
jgi:hypothetical protein